MNFVICSALMLTLMSAASEVMCQTQQALYVCNRVDASEDGVSVTTIQCDNGCCGEEGNPECCEDKYLWMKIVFPTLVGLILAVVVLICWKKHK